jgi:hypothetical protein
VNPGIHLVRSVVSAGFDLVRSVSAGFDLVWSVSAGFDLVRSVVEGGFHSAGLNQTHYAAVLWVDRGPTGRGRRRIREWGGLT